MEGETQPKLSKKLQVVTLCPLLSGILICTVIILGILFGKYLNWVSQTSSYIENTEQDNLIRLATAASNAIVSRVKQVKDNVDEL